MPLVVTGLSQTTDISTLHRLFEVAGLPTANIQVVTPDAIQSSLAGGIAGAELLRGDSGTGVPGLTGGHRMRSFFRSESASERLGDFEIPDSEIDNYVEALERGRSVVAYYATAETVARAMELFREAALLNVKTF